MSQTNSSPVVPYSKDIEMNYHYTEIETKSDPETPLPEIELSTPKKVTMSLKRHNGTTLEWKNIQYVVPTGEDKLTQKTILSNLSGVAKPGELLAVMGTSGAGKSTLLDVLAGRVDSPFLTGTLLTNGSAIDKKSFRREIGYVMQNDALFPLLTVEETIRYAAYLRIPDKTKEEKDEIVEILISLLRLEKCRNTIIGDDANRGLSGGEKRRVSIAVDIVHFPSIIFLDEPTSGLDSTTALSVIESLKTLAIQQNCTIIMTIHQPSARLFELINKVIFLSLGKIIYYGKVNNLSEYIQQIYQESGLIPSVTQGNLPETFLDLADQLLMMNKIDIMTSKFINHEALHSGIHSTLFSEKKESSGHFSSNSNNNSFAYANNIVYEVITLMHRNLTNIIRTKELFLARFFATIFFGILIGTLFLQTKNTLDGLNHRLAYFVFAVAFYSWNCLEGLPIFFNMKEIYQREYSSGAYRSLSFNIADLLMQAPFHLIIAILFCSITWWLVGLPSIASIFFFQIFIVFTILMTGNNFATLISVLVPDPMTGQTIGSAILSIMFMFSGFFIKRSQIPSYWIWMHYLSFFKFAFDSLIVNGLKDHASTDTMSNAEVLRYYSVNGINAGLGVGVLWGFILFFRLIIYYRLTTALSGTRK